MSNYDDLKLEELQDVAKERDLQGRSGLNKKELVDALEADDQKSGVVDDSGPSEEATKAYQEDYVPQRRKEVAEAAKEGVTLQPEGSDPDNPVVAEALEDNEVYQELTDEEKELANLAADASGPLHLEDPRERVMTGAVSEEQAKQQEAERAKLPDEFVGDLTEHVPDDVAKRVSDALAGKNPDEDQEFEPPLSEQFAARREAQGKLLKRTNDGRKAASAVDAEEKNIKETQDDEKNLVGTARVYNQRAVLDTTGLGGPGSDRVDRAYRTANLKSGQAQATFHADDPRSEERVAAEQERDKQLSGKSD